MNVPLTCFLSSNELTVIVQLAKDICVNIYAWEEARQCLWSQKLVLWILWVADFKNVNTLVIRTLTRKICSGKEKPWFSYRKGKNHSQLIQSLIHRLKWMSYWAKSDKFRACRTSGLHVEILLSYQYFLICLLTFLLFSFNYCSTKSCTVKPT